MENLANRYLNNILRNNKIGHAYLFYGNSEYNLQNYVLNFVKAMFCLKNINKEFFSCSTCKICKQIEHGNYVDFYIINVDSSIKKEDILYLKQEMSTKARFSRKVYWIKNIDSITPQAANSILKFLEEPEENITAILTTTNLKAVLDTIISRCQIINIGSDKKDLNINSEEIQMYIEFFQLYEKNRDLAILEFINFMENRKKVEDFIDYMIKKIADSNQNENKVELLSILLEGKKDLSMNVNYNLVVESILFKIVKKGLTLDI